MSLFLSQNELFVGLDTGQVIHNSSVHQPQTAVDFHIWAIRAVDRNLFTASTDTSIRQWDLLSNRADDFSRLVCQVQQRHHLLVSTAD